MADFKWQRIRGLSDSDRAIDLASIHSLYETWWAAKERLAKSSKAQLEDFTQRLVRRLTIETGILEHAYELDRGTTEALVASGFAEDLVARSSTNIEPSHLIDILRDQEAAIQIVLDVVAGNRRLSKGLIHELHAILMRNQDTTIAKEENTGKRVEIKLLKGQFKKLPNNPRTKDGTKHEYCPPIQVDAEIDRLIAYYESYAKEDPVVVASWLHHCFTQIHPYQDGNGRVGRALTTLVLLKANLLPLVIDRDMRSEYIKALESADTGDLTELVSLFAKLERDAILQGLSVNTDADMAQHQTVTAAVIENLRAKFGRRQEEKDEELRRVDVIGRTLRERAQMAVHQALNNLAAALPATPRPKVWVGSGGRDKDNAHWYRRDVIESAEKSGKFINFSEDHLFVKGTIKFASERLVFVVSFHHVGRELCGIIEATAFSKIEYYEDEDSRSASRDFVPCSVEPFILTWKTKVADVEDSFDRWLDTSIAISIKEYGDRI
ncbi:MAG: Fic family protein [Planctomycetota bacterium]